MLEQAIIDAAALREAALKNAEQSLIEKYAPQIKEAVEAMLESDGSSRRVKYENRIVNVIHETDANGNMTVAEAGGKAFVVQESEVSDLSEDEILNEEEEGMGLDAPDGGEASGIEAPFAGNPQMTPDEMVNLSLDVPSLDHEIEIDLDDLESKLMGDTMPEDDMVSTGELGDELALDDEMGGLLGGEETEEAGDELGGEEEELELQELMSLLNEFDGDLLDEVVAPGGVQDEEVLDGWFGTDPGKQEYKQDQREAGDNLDDDESEKEEDLEEDEGIAELYETIDLLKTQNSELESIVYKLSDKLEETLLSNAKLIYQNRTLCDASLNERQKDKIVEAIAKAESPKEAKQLHETLKSTVGSNKKKGPQSLSESVNRKSNLSGILNRRQHLNESQSNDPFLEKMQRLAGIKK